VIVTIFAFFQWLRSQNMWVTALAIIGTIGVWIWLIILIRRQFRRVRTFRAGRKGEDQVAEQLRQTLDHRWTIYRNLQLPGRKDDLDLVLVGPGGVWAVQVKATGAPLRVQAGRWELRRGGRWVAAQPDPARQVTGQATALNDFFKRQGFNRFVDRAIALAEPQPFDQFTTSEIPVWLPFNIAERAAALSTRHPPSAGELSRINELLARRALEQRATEDAPARRRRSRRGP
jgi:Nuclease-related domain